MSIGELHVTVYSSANQPQLVTVTFECFSYPLFNTSLKALEGEVDTKCPHIEIFSPYLSDPFQCCWKRC